MKNELKDNESICSDCGTLINDDTETKWSEEADPYCKDCFEKLKLKEVLRMCLDWYEEAPIDEIEAVEIAISKNFPSIEIREILENE